MTRLQTLFFAIGVTCRKAVNIMGKLHVGRRVSPDARSRGKEQDEENKGGDRTKKNWIIREIKVLIIAKIIFIVVVGIIVVLSLPIPPLAVSIVIFSIWLYFRVTRRSKQCKGSK